MEEMRPAAQEEVAIENWNFGKWWDPAREASEYLARRVYYGFRTGVQLRNGRIVASQLSYGRECMDLQRGKARTLLLVEQSDVWISLHHMFKVLPRTIHPDECTGGMERNIPPIPNPSPPGSFSFLFASERTSYSHLYLYTYCPGINGNQAIILRRRATG